MEVGALSPDGYYSWDGTKWVSVEIGTKSPDGFFIWNGTQWIPITDKINQPVVDKEPIQQVNHPVTVTQQKVSVTLAAGLSIWNGFEWVPNSSQNDTKISPHQVSVQGNMNNENSWNATAHQPHLDPGHQGYVQQFPQQQTMMVGLTNSNRWSTSKIVALVVIIPIIAVALLVVLSGVLYVWAANSLDLDATPEFGFRHDVNPSEFEDLGANRAPYYYGEQYPDFSSTVSIYGEDSTGDGWFGSGVIISEYWVLTAAHVVEGLQINNTWIYEGVDYEDEEGYAYQILNVFIHPGWNDDSKLMESGMDIALIELEYPIDMNRSGIAAWDNMPASERLGIGALLYTSGYGGYDSEYSECSDFCLTDSSGDYSQRRAWSNILDRDVKSISPSDSYVNDDIWHGGFIVYDFDSPGGQHNALASGKTSTLQQGNYGYGGLGTSSAMPLPLEGTSVQGDSGGPTYALLDGNWTVIGLTAHGSVTANYGDVSFNTRVASHTTWICSHDTQYTPITGC